MLGAFDGYLEALAAKDYASACAELSEAMHESLAHFTAASKAGCTRILPALLSPQASAVARGQAHGKVTRVRFKGDRGFVVFHAPGAKLYDTPMAREGGKWKVAAVASGVLAPEL